MMSEGEGISHRVGGLAGWRAPDECVWVVQQCSSRRFDIDTTRGEWGEM
jgi:hypothetical protein